MEKLGLQNTTWNTEEKNNVWQNLKQRKYDMMQGLGQYKTGSSGLYMKK